MLDAVGCTALGPRAAQVAVFYATAWARTSVVLGCARSVINGMRGAWWGGFGVL